jgi:glucose/arabinose dehydrogenase
MRGKRSAARLLAVAIGCSAVAGLGSGSSTVSAAQAGGRDSATVRSIEVRTVAVGLNGPAGFTFTPDGRIVYLERGSGEVRILDPATRKDRLFFRLRGVSGDGERGALGVAVHPRWPAEPFVYVYVTRRIQGALRNQIVRIESVQGAGAHMEILVSTPASSSPYHNGGRISFGPDGKLYAIVGDGHDSSNSQDRSDNLLGKILRMTPTGAAPPDNPFPGSTIFAFGIRNSFGFAFDPKTGRLWETDNGPGCNDELNLIVAGRNYAWGTNQNCGSAEAPLDTNNSGPQPRQMPELFFRAPIGITGAAFCDGCGLGRRVEGDLFFGDANDGALRRVVLDAARDDVARGPVKVLDAPAGAIYSIEVGPDGRIYFSDDRGIYRLSPA